MASKGVDVSSGKLIFGNLGVLEKVGMSGWKNFSVVDLWIVGVFSLHLVVYLFVTPEDCAMYLLLEELILMLSFSGPPF